MNNLKFPKLDTEMLMIAFPLLLIPAPNIRVTYIFIQLSIIIISTVTVTQSQKQQQQKLLTLNFEVCEFVTKVLRELYQANILFRTDITHRFVKLHLRQTLACRSKFSRCRDKTFKMIALEKLVENCHCYNQTYFALLCFQKFEGVSGLIARTGSSKFTGTSAMFINVKWPGS